MIDSFIISAAVSTVEILGCDDKSAGARKLSAAMSTVEIGGGGDKSAGAPKHAEPTDLGVKNKREYETSVCVWQ